MGLLTLYFILFLLLILFFILVALWLTDKLINRLLGIKKKGKIADTPGKYIDYWGRAIILVTFLISFLFLVSKDANTSVFKWFWLLYWVVIMGFQSLLEWKYLKDSKQYISTLIYLMLFLVVLYNIENLFKLLV